MPPESRAEFTNRQTRKYLLGTFGDLMTSLATLVSSDTFPLKDELLNALAQISPAVVTDEDLRSFDGCRLARIPPVDQSVKELLDLTAAKDSSVKHDLHGRTALGQLLTLTIHGRGSAKADGSTPNAAAREAELFGKGRYDEVERKMVTRFRTVDRVDGKTVKKLSDNLDSGMFTRDTYVLKGLTSTQAVEETKHEYVGGVPVERRVGSTVKLTSTPLVLTQIYRCTRLWLAAGYREITPSAKAPSAASCGDFAVVKYKLVGGGTKTTRHHITPEQADAYFLSALEASSYMGSATALAGAHTLMCDSIGELIGRDSYNLGSAVMRGLQDHSWAKKAAEVLKEPSDDDAGAPTDTSSAGDTTAELVEAQKKVTQLSGQLRGANNTIEDMRAARDKRQRPDGGTSPAGGRPRRAACHGFQLGKCDKAAKDCAYDHRCQKCNSTDHGLSTCPQV